jgi:hypothetical protein
MLLIVTVPALADAQTLREQVRTAGISEEVLLVDYPELALRDMTSAANAVLHVSIRSGASFLSDNGETIHTDYPAAVIEVMKGSRVKSGDVITIRRKGGVMEIDGRKVFSNESGFPPFAPGEYVLFLKKSGKTYELLAGPQSAFRVQAGTIASAADEQRSAAVLMPLFVSEVKEFSHRNTR